MFEDHPIEAVAEKENLLQSEAIFPSEEIVGITSPEVQFFVWRSYRKMSKAVRRMQKKIEKHLKAVRKA